MTIPIIKQCPPELTGGKILYVSSDGKFYNKNGREIKPSSFNPNFKPKPNVHSYYPRMRRFGDAACHVLVCATFHGPRQEGYECDHINGNIFDWRASNLQWVTRAENIRRAKILRAMRRAGEDPTKRSRAQLLDIFAHYTVASPSDPSFDQSLYDMTHHCEY